MSISCEKDKQASLESGVTHCLETSVVGYPVHWYNLCNNLTNYKTHQYTNQHNNDDDNNKQAEVRATLTVPVRDNQDDTKSMRHKIHNNIDKEDECFLWCYLLFPITIVALHVSLIMSAILYVPNSSFQVDSLGVTSMSVTNNITNNNNNNNNFVTVTSAGLNLTLSMMFKEATIVESLLVLVDYHGEMFSLAMVRPTIYQAIPQQIVRLEMGGVKGAQLSESAVSSVVKDLASYKELEFTVHVQGRVWSLKDGEDNKYEIQVICKGIEVMFSPPYNMTNGKMINAPIQCFDIYDYVIHYSFLDNR